LTKPTIGLGDEIFRDTNANVSLTINSDLGAWIEGFSNPPKLEPSPIWHIDHKHVCLPFLIETQTKNRLRGNPILARGIEIKIEIKIKIKFKIKPD